MSFMISRETENVGSLTEVESAFQAITSGGDKPFVTQEELMQVGPQGGTYNEVTERVARKERAACSLGNSWGIVQHIKHIAIEWMEFHKLLLVVYMYLK